MVSIKQIAADLGVSAATVSNALTGKGRVSEALGNRIRARASELGYRPSSVARALKTGRSGILGLVMPDLTNPLFPRIAQTLAQAADSRQMGVLIADSRGSEAEQTEALRRLVDRGVDGLLVVPSRGTTIAPQPKPTVVINAASDQTNTISADHHGGGAQIAAHMLDLGHKRLALLGNDPVSLVQQDRIAGMRAALPSGTEAHVLWGNEGLDSLPFLVAQGVTAVLATSDLMALRVHSHLTQRGLSVPGDVSLSGFDDLPLATAMHPALTTIAQDMEAIAMTALAILLDQIEGRPAREVGQTVPTRLVIRQSTAQPRPT